MSLSFLPFVLNLEKWQFNFRICKKKSDRVQVGLHKIQVGQNRWQDRRTVHINYNKHVITALVFLFLFQSLFFFLS